MHSTWVPHLHLSGLPWSRDQNGHLVSLGMLAHKLKLVAGSLLAGTVGYAGWTLVSHEVFYDIMFLFIYFNGDREEERVRHLRVERCQKEKGPTKTW